MKYKYNLWVFLALCCLFFSTNASYAQNQSVKGKITDSGTGEALPGVNIIIKGTTLGTSTSAEGTYVLTPVAPTDTLMFSYIGYQTQTIFVNNRQIINVQMVAQAVLSQELVVVGYGQQQKGDVTGVVEKVGAKNFNQGVIVSPEQLLVGKVSGVTIKSNSGEPGGQTKIRIRGGTSINASNEPLIVIDGVPINNSPHDPGGFQVGRNPLNFLNPEDIESFTVLKDASATAIYGSRGANGVVMITTKKGVLNQTGQLHYDGWLSVANNVGQTDVLSSQQFRDIVAEKAPGRLELLGNANIDWQKQILRPAIGQNHYMSFAGGTNDITYRASLGYLDQQGIIETSNTKRLSLNLDYSQHFLENQLLVTASVKGARTQDRFVPNGVIANAVSFAPTQPIYDAASQWAGYWEWNNDLGTKNPVAESSLTQDYGDDYRSIGNIQFDYTLPFITGLNAKLNLGYDVVTGERKRFLPSYLRTQYSTKGEIRRAGYTRTNALLDAYVNYEHTLGQIKSTIKFTGGYSYQNFNNSYPEFRAWDLSSNLLGLNSAAPARQNSSFISVLDNRLISYFGRINYSYDEKYLLTATLRRDGSSRFAPSNQWGTFPSAAAAWRVINEPFMKNLKPVLSDFKLRVGWGITGNQEIGDFRFLPTYTFGDNMAQYQFGNEFVTTLRPNGVDPNLKWEQTESYNIGIDYGLWEDRITGSVEYYYKKTNDLLSEVTVPAGSNLTNIILTNIGSMSNRGVEFLVNGVLVNHRDIIWNMSVNAAYNKNKITKLTNFNDPAFQGYPRGDISGGTGNQIQILRVGSPLNAFYVYKQLYGTDGKPLPDGVDNNGDGVINLADMYANTNGDNVVNDLDKVPYGKPAPDVTLGLSSQVSYKNFDLGFTLRGSFGQQVYNNVASNYGNYSRVISDIVPANMQSSVLYTNFNEPQLFSDYYIENASFLRMDNITLGYTLREIIPQVRRIRIYGTIQNLFVITNYSGLDPEVGNGIDNNVYPRARTFTMGISLDF